MKKVGPFFPDRECENVREVIEKFMDQLWEDVSGRLKSDDRSLESAKLAFRSADTLMKDFLGIVSGYSVNIRNVPNEGKAVILVISAEMRSNLLGTKVSATQSEMLFNQDSLLADGHSIEDAMRQLGTSFSEVISEDTGEKHNLHPYVIVYGVPNYSDKDVISSMTFYGMTCSATPYECVVYYDSGDGSEYFPTYSTLKTSDEIDMGDNHPVQYLMSFYVGVLLNSMPGNTKEALLALKRLLSDDDDE